MKRKEKNKTSHGEQMRPGGVGRGEVGDGRGQYGTLPWQPGQRDEWKCLTGNGEDVECTFVPLAAGHNGGFVR